ncbi:unnamed protein product [Cyprideis torosa]|uniref:3-hydroxy-3-methylglutaryl coenzyme A reductase n=1 Tax=Cyprideis torosa TaxID=163714 RepID=A0A7R8W4I6_9CRUS|nr:unnamed protein product [Cyprideis torosa]CAG0880663.1 unnamed protein product [Cyprideis torosa]
MGIESLFALHGSFCISYSWEVIFIIFSVSFCAIPGNMFQDANLPSTAGTSNAIPSTPLYVPAAYRGLDAIFMSLIRCAAILNGYQQWKNLKKVDGRIIVVLLSLFTAVSSFVFSSLALNLLNKSIHHLDDFRDALFLFVLFIDLSKVGLFAQYVLMVQDKASISSNIIHGLELMGPSLVLDTLVEILVIGVGTLSGIRRLEMICNCACLGVGIRFLIFITFLPSALSLLTDFLASKDLGIEVFHCTSEQLRKIKKTFGSSDFHIPGDIGNDDRDSKQMITNRAARRVKVIMSIGLAVIHIVCRAYRWSSPPPSLFLYEDATDENAGAKGTNGVLYLISSHSQSVVLAIIFGSLLYKHLMERREADEIMGDPRGWPPTKGTEASSEGTKRVDSLFNERKNIYMSSLRSSKTDLASALKSPVPRVEILPAPTPSRKAMFQLGGDDNSDEEVVKNLNLPLDVACQPRLKQRRVRNDSESTMVDDGEEDYSSTDEEEEDGATKSRRRSVGECEALMLEPTGPALLTDREVLMLVRAKKLPPYRLETALNDAKRGVRLRRKLLRDEHFGKGKSAISDLPFHNFDYQTIVGACCENVIGHVSLPVGVAGPLPLNGEEVLIPMATTEGCLVASTNRGCRALSRDGGVTTSLLGDGMTRGPCLKFPTARKAAECLSWIQDKDRFVQVKSAFDSTSRFARLSCVKGIVAGRLLFLRFVAKTGDAMGMNMVSKGVEIVLKTILTENFPEVEIVTLSGNVCCDKKPAAINWIEGRGKSVVAEAYVSELTLSQVLKTTAKRITTVNTSKNLIGSAMAGAMGGFNSHAANIIAAIFIATGQDPAQVVESANCITICEEVEEGGVRISVTMPSIEVGTVGGGTFLKGQSACMNILGVKGSNLESPGANATQLASVVSAAVLAGELNILAALAEGELVKAHMTHNRSSVNMIKQHGHHVIS